MARAPADRVLPLIVVVGLGNGLSGSVRAERRATHPDSGGSSDHVIAVQA